MRAQKADSRATVSSINGHGPQMSRRNRQVSAFFNGEYRWWEDVYDRSLPRGFFSFEMIRRKEILLGMLAEMSRDRSPVAVLECGCGPGGILAEINAGGNLLAGVDINFNALSTAKNARAAGRNLVQADIERLPYKNDSFDITYCVGVLSYLESDRRAIEEICRVVKPGGNIIIAVPGLVTLGKILDPYYYSAWIIGKAWQCLRRHRHGRSANGDRYTAEMIRRYRYGELDRLYRECGLRKIRSACVSFGPPTFWRKELVPLRHAIRISEVLARFSNRASLRLLARFANHWVVSLEKPLRPAGEGI